MAYPRLNFYRDTNKPATFGKLPQILSKSKLPVYNDYYVKDFRNGINFSNYDQERFFDTNYPNPWIYEDFRHSTKASYDVQLPSGRYICRSEEIAKYYVPTEEKGLFLKFAKLGREREPNEDKILDFTKEYGFLKNTEEINSLEFNYIQYPIEAMHLYAREAYIVWRLYIFLIYNEHRNLRKWLLEFLTKFPDGYRIFWDLLDWDWLMTNHFYRLPRSLQVEILKEGKRLCLIEASNGNLIVEDEEEYPIDPAYLNSLPDDNPDWRFHSEPNWESIFQRASDEVLCDIALETICLITNKRINFKSWFSVNFNVVKKKNGKKISFEGSWNSQNLLSSIWLHFYFKITNQSSEIYKICPVCEEPIINPRKNQLYHEGCRQIRNNRIRRQIQRLWKNGKTIEEISEEVELTVEEVKKRIKPIEKD